MIDSSSAVVDKLESVHITDYGFLVKIKPTTKGNQLVMSLGIKAHSGLTDTAYNITLNVPS